MQALPQDLEESARAHRALQRPREVKRAVDLLRLALAYTVCDWPLHLLGAWFMLMGLGNLSDVAVLKRLRRCSPWLGRLIVAWLQARRLALSQRPGVRLRLVDATAVSRPGSQGTDWRVHLSLDLGNLCLDGIEVTDAHGGETLARFAARPGEVLVADRGLAFASGMGAILASRAGLLVRINWQNLPLTTQEGQRLDLIRWLQQVDRACERPVGLCTPQGSFRLRLMACPIAAQAAEAAHKKGRTVSPHTLLAAGFILLLTNLPCEAWPTEQVFELYRIRWQIEMLIKRLKGLLHLDGLRAKDPALAQTYLLGKLLAALLLDEFTNATAICHPPWFASTQRPVSPGRLTLLLYQTLQQILRGYISPMRILTHLPQLSRYLCDPPRRRAQKLAHARTFLLAFQPYVTP